MTEDNAARPVHVLARTSTLDLDDLLAEIRSRAEGAQESRERLAGLLDAVVAVSSDLDLHTVLERIVSAACALIDARYGALGIIDESGRHLVGFVTHGVAPDEVQGAPPSGHGLLGMLLREPQPLRMTSASQHPAAVGRLPPGHPPIDTFVGAPIRAQDRVFGNLYLTQKGGGGEFTDEDEQLIVALAAAAGIAIEKAQLYRRARRSRDWARAVGDLTQTLLEGRNERAALARMVKRARDLGEAELAVFAVVEPGADHLIVQAVETGPGVEALAGVGTVLPSARWRMVLTSRTPVLLVVEAGDDHVGELSSDLRGAFGLPAHGATAVVPIAVGEVEIGVIALAWHADALSDAADTMDSLPGFAEQMGLVLEAGRAQRVRSRAALLEDRDRIARDMHDHVIQRLYATGLSLQAVTRRADGVVRERIESAVDNLDAAVKDIRHAIFELHHPIPEGGLGPELEAIVEAAAEGFGFTPDVSFEGLGDIPMECEADVLAVVREALSNSVRHARAQDAQLRVSALEQIVVCVRDDGVGVDDDAGRSGLVNLRERAQAWGGTLRVNRLAPHGTEVIWSIPLPGGSPG